MSTRHQEILEAAMGLFSRYGISRTTMAEIAQSAGLSRQTLYNAYPNKEEILRAVVRESAARDVQVVQTAWATAPDLSAKIDCYFEQCPLAWYDLVANAPDAAEIIDGLSIAAKPELDEAMAKWRTLFADLFAQTKIHNPDTVADFFISASKTAKFDAPSRAVLQDRLSTLKNAVLALIEAETPDRSVDAAKAVV